MNVRDRPLADYIVIFIAVVFQLTAESARCLRESCWKWIGVYFIESRKYTQRQKVMIHASTHMKYSLPRDRRAGIHLQLDDHRPRLTYIDMTCCYISMTLNDRHQEQNFHLSTQVHNTGLTFGADFYLLRLTIWIVHIS